MGNIFNLLKDNPMLAGDTPAPVHSSMDIGVTAEAHGLIKPDEIIEAEIDALISEITPVKVAPLTPGERIALTHQWQSMDLLAVIPLGRRNEAAAIIHADPNSRQILELCRLGTFDCFAAMEALGMKNPCACFDGGYCFVQADVPVYKNLNQLSACPKGNEPLALPCLACNHHVSVGVRTFLAARDTTSNIFADVSGSSRSV